MSSGKWRPLFVEYYFDVAILIWPSLYGIFNAPHWQVNSARPEQSYKILAILQNKICPSHFIIEGSAIFAEVFPGVAISTQLNHWGRGTHICVGSLTVIGSDNALPPGRRRAIIWTNTEILLFGPLATKPSEIIKEIPIFSFMQMHLNMSSALRNVGLDVLMYIEVISQHKILENTLLLSKIIHGHIQRYMQLKYWSTFQYVHS